MPLKSLVKYSQRRGAGAGGGRRPMWSTRAPVYDSTDATPGHGLRFPHKWTTERFISRDQSNEAMMNAPAARPLAAHAPTIANISTSAILLSEAGARAPN
ncbi:hypothetical protein EVAR_24133_1 [Eumeta japonica]|uniref:Uncharacterized protein n=1 Tax=Eumeta variegata TaxID=151549 RepID=A0A4C1YMH4_EUMVA|nr:hypothetical protein EVAR_24133_1 [Eumeta japonica]